MRGPDDKDSKKADITTVRWWPVAVIAGFGVAWLAGTLASLVGVLGGYSGQQLAIIAPVTTVLSLAILLIGGALTGAGAGLAARTLLTRRGADRWLDQPLRRLAATGAAGLAAGAAAAGAVYAVLGRMPASPATVAGTVAATALAGGCLAAVRQRAVVVAGMIGTAGMLVVQFIRGLFTSPLSRLFGGENTLAEVALGHQRLALAGSFVAGAAAGYLAYRVLRGAAPTGSGIAAHLVAGATAGLVSLFAEGVTFLAAPAILGDRAAGNVSVADDLALAAASQSRLNGALIVAFTGAIIAVLALGRTRRPATGANAREAALKAYEQRQRANGPGKSGAAKAGTPKKSTPKTSTTKDGTTKTNTTNGAATSKKGTRPRSVRGKSRK